MIANGASVRDEFVEDWPLLFNAQGRIHYLIICERTIKASFEVKEHIRLLYRGHACKLMYIHMREVNHPLYKGAIHV